MIKKVSFLFFYLLLFSLPLNGQCPEILTQDIVRLCPSEATVLELTSNGTILFPEWTPSKGLSDPLSLQPIITNPFDTTYRLTAKGFIDAQNKLRNSNFDEGYSGFTSLYEAENPIPGGYIIGTTSTDLYPNANPCADHTGSEGIGNMLMVKVSTSENTEIYCQEVSVRSGKDYFFRAYASGLVKNKAPELILTINEEVFSRDTLSPTECSWQEINAHWEAGLVEKARICISVSQEEIGAGNDFALDDIGFYELCEVEKTVEVATIDFQISNPDTVNLPCGDSIRLNAQIIPGDIYFLTNWNTSDGQIIKGAQTLRPLIDQPGAYNLEVITTLDNKTCMVQKTISVLSTSANPLLIDPTSGQLHCQQKETTLTAQDEVDRTKFLYSWSTDDGNIVTSFDVPAIIVNQKGNYLLTRTGLFGECPVTAQIQVLDQTLNDYSFKKTLPDCFHTTGSILFDSISGGAPPFVYSADSGRTFQADPFFGALPDGDYQLVVQDKHGCTLAQQTSFTSFSPVQLDFPEELLLRPGQNYQLPLSTNLPDALITNVRWSPNEDLSCGDCLQPYLTASKTKSYQVIVEDYKGCIAEKTIDILVLEPSDIYIPTAFSPNGDGHNDLFSINSNLTKVDRILLFSVYDRYGSRIFEAIDFLPNDSSMGWNGRFKGQELPTGVYLYRISAKMKDGKINRIQGSVTLTR